MKHFNLKLVSIMSLLIFNFSCDEDFLDRAPLDAPLAETFLSSETELEMAVTGVYNTLWFHPPGVLIPFAISLEYATDNGWDRNGSDLQALGRGDATTDNQFTASYWTTFYRGIGRANYILSNSEHLKKEMKEEKYNRLMAEVRFLRAYFYSYLTELFGDVPLITKASTLQEAEVARMEKSEVVDFILSELDAIEQYLPLAPTAKNKVTLGATLALQSRVALFNGRWQKSAEAAKNLFSRDVYHLHNDFGKLFEYEGEDSPEIILSIPYMDGIQVHPLAKNLFSRMALGFSSKVPPQQLVDSYSSIDGLSIDKSPLYNPEQPFKNRDPRLQYTIVLPGSRSINHIFNTNPEVEEVLFFGEDPPVMVKNTEATNAYSSFTGYLFRKYADPEDYPESSKSSLNFIIFRYAEILLNYAEAKIELNQIDESVYDAINALRTRPTVNMPKISQGKNQEELRNLVRKERRWEMVNEGLRLFDIHRWGIAEEVMNGPVLGRIPTDYLSNAPKINEFGTPDYDNVDNADQMDVVERRHFDPARDYLWPIPRIDLETNYLLEQNPGY